MQMRLEGRRTRYPPPRKTATHERRFEESPASSARTGPQIIRAQQDVLHETKVHSVECDEDLIGFRITLLVRLDHSIGSTPSLKDLILGYVYRA